MHHFFTYHDERLGDFSGDDEKWRAEKHPCSLDVLPDAKWGFPPPGFRATRLWPMICKMRIIRVAQFSVLQKTRILWLYVVCFPGWTWDLQVIIVLKNWISSMMYELKRLRPINLDRDISLQASSTVRHSHAVPGIHCIDPSSLHNLSHGAAMSLPFCVTEHVPYFPNRVKSRYFLILHRTFRIMHVKSIDNSRIIRWLHLHV